MNGATTNRIEPDVLRRIFQPFAQADRSLERRDGGLGLGLTIAKGLVELHGGTIDAESAGRGTGARFRIHLPLEGEPAALKPSANVTPINARQGRRFLSRRVLIVEDNPDAAETLRVLLELLKYDVKVASTGPDGIRVAEEWLPDAVLCDLGLPGLDGFGVAREIRRNPAVCHARLIAITGYGSHGDRNKAIASGFDHHLVKPVDPYVLIETLESND